MLDELFRTVAELYEEHRQAAFPRRLVVTDVNGVEMVSLDSNVSGCVSTWLKNGGRIDDRRWGVLADCEQKLNRAIPALDGYEASYYQRLLDMTVLTLENPEDTQPE
ncbi:hypothetical protein ONA91_33055 [Micromonospora sp. DR5-3]|uniref:hypothetical protein n=1 Tax=unclassified Micromonospora TaxID=2617518 RepID=UPI0011D8FA2C|nr:MULTISPECIES: hypothetical protein [unclassified Micromonospora]MCW3819282.1 hypothetical protein [Micromonospora sp. DR5-3]TYC20316.1 hypothetical protein FXF52_31940 [Micromonospora sp. MP36]